MQADRQTDKQIQAHNRREQIQADRQTDRQTHEQMQADNNVNRYKQTDRRTYASRETTDMNR